MDLKPEATYHIRSVEQAIRMGQFANLLRHVVPVEVNPNGGLIRMVDSRKQLPDGGEDLTASGAALMSGMVRKPMFRGTGYDTRQHTQGDFGSNVYVVEEV